MKIDEAINKCEYGIAFTDEEYVQIAEWLEELQMYKSLAPRELVSQKQRNDRNAEYHKGFNDGYNKAIDDFAETIKTSQEAHLWYCSDYGLEFCNGDNCEECSHEFTKQIDKIAEKLKQVE